MARTRRRHWCKANKKSGEEEGLASDSYPELKLMGYEKAEVGDLVVFDEVPDPDSGKGLSSNIMLDGEQGRQQIGGKDKKNAERDNFAEDEGGETPNIFDSCFAEVDTEDNLAYREGFAKD